jgi:hypothetical protein
MKSMHRTRILFGNLATFVKPLPLLALCCYFSCGQTHAIVTDFASGYTTNAILDGLPTSGTHWTRVANNGNANSAYKVIPGNGVDRAQTVTTQGTDGTVTSASYNFNPSSTDLGGTFNSSSSIIDYSFSMRLEADPNTSPGDVQRVLLGNSIAAEICLLGNGTVHAYSARTPITLKTTMGGSTNFVALGGVYFTVSGQLNYATKTFTVFLNGVAQTIGGPTDTTNFPFYVTTSSSPLVGITNVDPQETTWLPSSLSHFEYQLDPIWSGPITISSGGTYTGNWASTSATTPAVTIMTSAPVTIQNSNIKGPYHLIYTSNVGAYVTVTNCKGYGENPNVSGQVMPRFIYAYNVQSLTVTNNYLESTAGIEVYGNYKSSQMVSVSKNYAFNIDGRLSDGAGGFSGSPTQLSQLVQFCQINSMLNLSAGAITWNKIVNVPNESRVEDSINILKSGGTSGNLLQITSNYVQGGYPCPATSGSYTGTGITCSDGGGGETAATSSQYVSATSNVVVNDYSNGMAIYDGHDITCSNNQVYSCATIGVDTSIQYGNATGMIRWDLYGNGTGVYYNDTMTGNYVGWVNANYSVPHAGERDYYYSPAYPAGVTGNTLYSGAITAAVEQTAVDSWYSAASMSGITIGPNW